MWFVSKKKYDALLKQKEDLDRIATNAVSQNGRLLTQMDETIKEMKSAQALNHRLVRHNEELVAQNNELKAKVDFVIEQRDYYYDLLESTSEADKERD